MEAHMLLQSQRGSVTNLRSATRLRSVTNGKMTRRECSSMNVKSVLRRPSAATTASSISIIPDTIISSTAPSSTTVYTDSWFDRIAIHYLSRCIQLITGMKNEKTGYEGLVEAAAALHRSSNGNIDHQQGLVLQALNKAFPKPIHSFVRNSIPQSQFKRELFAKFTTLFCVWLVGRSEIKESEVEGRKEKNVVHIKKCRFLEESKCVGMCVNLCKMPSQKFIKDSLGMPVNMVPNFEDMSCEMIFGQEPPAPENDPAFRQPCYKFLCKSKQKHTSGCSTL
ncbi:hypothetical protein MKW94_012611 [Papaver nudicaule]|uniref:Beta-carotene isomerase D27-like C-terminal domain-containing protein n=1 Tax=Papaver nudicaule TaxID=74823 RepID=A0AA41SDU9_PAPNU|nr:hypothetical protein [Papaver nudicaule]